MFAYLASKFSSTHETKHTSTTNLGCNLCNHVEDEYMILQGTASTSQYPADKVGSLTEIKLYNVAENFKII